MNDQMGNRFAPVKVGEELDVTIEAVGEKGDGIAKKNGFVLFVPSTKQGDEVRIRVTRVMKKVGFAEVIGKAEAGSAPVHKHREPAENIEIDESKDSEDFGDDTEEQQEE